jgi:hypothetical protein
MRDIVNRNADLLRTLHSTSNGPMTAFLISDAAVSHLNHDAQMYLKTNTALLLQVIRIVYTCCVAIGIISLQNIFDLYSILCFKYQVKWLKIFIFRLDFSGRYRMM